MKKFKIFLIVLSLLIVTGCGVKEVGTMDDFNNAAVENGLEVRDNMSNYKVDYINEASIATNASISMEMIVYDSEDTASKVQENNIKSFKNLKSVGSSIKESNGKNYYKFVMISNGYYMVSSRIDNTLVFTKTELKNKDIVNNILDKMGY